MNISKRGFETRKSFWLGWVPLAFYTVIVIIFSVISASRIPEVITRINDKLLHNITYFILFWIALNAFLLSARDWLCRHPLRGAFFYCVMIGALTEVLQAFTADRRPEMLDWAADISAALEGLILYGFFHLLTRWMTKRVERAEHDEIL